MHLYILLIVLVGISAATAVDTNSPITANATFSAPEELFIGKNFIAKCTVSLNPFVVDYNVTYYLNDKPLGQYVVKLDDKKVPHTTWETLNLISGLNLFNRQTDSKYPNYHVLFEPKTIASEGLYKCSITANVPNGGIARYFSNTWDAQNVSGKNSTPPTVSLVYSNEPMVTEIKVGQNFIGKCHLNMSPSIVNYNVTFIIDRYMYAYYYVKGDQPKPTIYWKSTGSNAFVNIFRGNQASYPDFTIQIVPKGNVSINFQFKCSVDVEILPGGKANYDSKTECTLSKYC